MGLIPGLGRSPGGGNGNPLQHSCLQDPMNRGTWQATVHGITESQTGLKRVSTHVSAWRGFPGGAKNLPANAGDVDLIPGLGRSPGGGNGNPLQYSCLENSMNRRAWWVTAHAVAESDTTEHEYTCIC